LPAARAFHAGDGGAGQRGRFLKAEVLGNAHQAGFIEHDVLGQHAVDVAAERTPRLGWGEGAVEPVLHEDGGYAVTGLPGGDAFADLHHFTGAVGAWNAGKLQFWVVEPFDHQQITIVEGNRTDLDQHFTGVWRGGWPLHKLQRINTKRRNLPSSHEKFYLFQETTIFRAILNQGSAHRLNPRRIKIGLVDQESKSLEDSDGKYIGATGG
jgi:hypothetical protein